jgi:hypothetical protein
MNENVILLHLISSLDLFAIFSRSSFVHVPSIFSPSSRTRTQNQPTKIIDQPIQFSYDIFLLIHLFLQGLGCRESKALGSLDFNGLTSLWVTPSSGRSFRQFKGSKTQKVDAISS